MPLIARHPRRGDRSRRNDDRYLFLETVMAARSRLHLSYQHEGAQDGKPRNPAAPLAELLAWLAGRGIAAHARGRRRARPPARERWQWACADCRRRASRAVRVGPSAGTLPRRRRRPVRG